MIGLSSVERMSVGTTVEQRQGEREADRRGIRHLRVFAALGGLSQSLAGGAAALLAREVTGSDAAGGLPQALLVVGAGTSALGLAGFGAPAGSGVRTLGGSGGRGAWLRRDGGGRPGRGARADPLRQSAPRGGQHRRHAVPLRGGGAGSGRPAPRAMASVLVATSVGAVVGPNLMLPSGMLAGSFDVPPLIGSYLVAAIVYLAGLQSSSGLGERCRRWPRPPRARSHPRRRDGSTCCVEEARGGRASQCSLSPTSSWSA